MIIAITGNFSLKCSDGQEEEVRARFNEFLQFLGQFAVAGSNANIASMEISTTTTERYSFNANNPYLLKENRP